MCRALAGGIPPQPFLVKDFVGGVLLGETLAERGIEFETLVVSHAGDVLPRTHRRQAQRIPEQLNVTLESRSVQTSQNESSSRDTSSRIRDSGSVFTSSWR